MLGFGKLFVRRVRQEPLPLITQYMREYRLKWVRGQDGTPMMVCDFCGGNCGQCGKTSIVGNVPFSMGAMVQSLHAGKA